MDIYALLDELRTIARNGLQFASNPCDRERHERLMKLATQSYGELLDVPEEAVRARSWKEMGYVTPKLGANAAIFDDRGEISVDEAGGHWGVVSALWLGGAE